jgi:hypothetical protein
VKSASPVDDAPVLVEAQPSGVPTAVLGESPASDTPPTKTPTAVTAQAQPTATPTTAPTQVPPSPQPTATQPPPLDAASQPLAMLLQPAVTSGGSVNLEGWAWSENLRSYRVEVSPASGGTWSVIGQSSSPVRGGTVGVWRTTGYAPGAYNLRIVVQDASGEYASSPIRVVLGS